MALYVEGIHRVDGGHLIQASAIVPGLRSQRDDEHLVVGPYTTIQGGIEHAGSVSLCRGSVTWTDVRAGPELIVGADCIVSGDVEAAGRVVVQAGARIDGTLRAGGDVHLLGNSTVHDVRCRGDIVVVGSPTTGELQPDGRVRTRGY